MLSGIQIHSQQPSRRNQKPRPSHRLCHVEAIDLSLVPVSSRHGSNRIRNILHMTSKPAPTPSPYPSFPKPKSHSTDLDASSSASSTLVSAHHPASSRTLPVPSRDDDAPPPPDRDLSCRPHAAATASPTHRYRPVVQRNGDDRLRGKKQKQRRWGRWRPRSRC